MITGCAHVPPWRWIPLLLAATVLPSVVLSQNDSVPAAEWDHILLDDGGMILRAGAHLATSPLRWEGSDWARFGMTAAATGVAFSLDDEVRSVALNNQNPSLDRLADIAQWFGEGKVVLIATSTAYLAGLFLDQRWIRESALLSATAALYAAILTRVLKPVVGRARPYVGNGNADFHMFSFDDDYNSFPSGHTVAAFSVAAVLARRVDNFFATVGLYTIATSTALSRVYTDQHWFSDVVFGGVMSILLANSLVDWFEGQAERSKDGGFRITPSENGVRVAWVF